MQCAKCGAESPSQARFCRNCGARLSPEAQAPTPSPTQTVSPDQRAQRLLEEAFRQAEQGRTLAAIQTCQQAIAINPRSTSAHSLLGTLYERQGDREKAIREYEQVLVLSPDSTVERRRLNELMGVPAAREGVAVSPRVARLVVTGAASVVIVVVAIAAIVATSHTPTLPQAGNVAPRRQMATAPQGGGAYDSGPVPTPGQLYLGQQSNPLPPPPLPSLPRQMNYASPRQMGGRQSMPMNAYAANGAARYYGTGGAAAPAPVPMAGAVAYRGGAPVVSAPQGRANVSWPANPQTGQGYYLQGDYRRSAEAYQSYLQQNPAAGGAVREELAWVYTEMGDRSRAEQQYHEAISQYQAEMARGSNTEAARHGLRTCEAAIRALQAR